MTPAYRRDLSDLLRLATPVVGTRLGIMAMGLTDTVVVGRHSTTELGYVALGWAPTVVVLTTGIGLLSGVQVLTARRVGAGRPELAGPVLRRGVIYAFWLGLVSAMLLAALGPGFLRLTGVEPDLARGAGRALTVFSWSLPLALIANAAGTWLEAVGRPQPAMWAMWGANLVNLVLQLMLVPHLGALGAAYGTAGARLVLVASLGLVLVTLRDADRLGLRGPPVLDHGAAAEQRRIGYAAGAAFFAETAAFSGMNVIAGWIGGLAVAGWAVVLNVAALIFMVPLGLSAAASVLVARAHGGDDRHGVARAGAVAFGVTIAFGAAITTLVWACAGFIASLYTPDPALQAVVAGALGLACLFFIADGLQVVAAHMLRARGDVWMASAAQILSYAVVMLPLGWALGLPAGMGLEGIVWAVVTASLLSASLLVARFWMLSGR